MEQGVSVARACGISLGGTPDVVCWLSARERRCLSSLQSKAIASGEMSLTPTATGEPAAALGEPAAAQAVPAPVASESGELASLLLPLDLRLSPEQFALVCAANPHAVLELAADGRLITMTPTGGETGARNSLLIARLQIWALARGGWTVFDSSSGFRLPDGSVLSPDAALVRLERWQALTAAERRGFPPLCPDLVVELASPSDGGARRRPTGWNLPVLLKAGSCCRGCGWSWRRSGGRR